MKNRLFAFFSILVLAGTVAFGQIPASNPEAVGFSSERMARIDSYLQKLADEKKIAGAVAMVARRGKVAYAKSFGVQDFESGLPMQDDAIFRIYSMSKPITSVGIMMLYEEGHFQLNDPVSRFLPQFKGLKVAVEKQESNAKRVLMVPAVREMTIRDLLRHTSGLTYGFFGSSAVDRIYVEARALGGDTDLAGMIDVLGGLPLKHQPGSTWEYSVSTDVLGRIIEVVSGKPFDQFLEERILGPLKMSDTAFHVPGGKKERLTGVYSRNPQDDSLEPVPADSIQSFLVQPKFLSGGGGLVSTASDYLRFCQMILNKGELEGVRLLGRRTVEMMTQDHLGNVEVGFGLSGFGFGLGFAVHPDPGVSGQATSKGTASWGGMASTKFWIDPEEELTGVFMIQIFPDNGTPYGGFFQELVYQAIVD